MPKPNSSLKVLYGESNGQVLAEWSEGLQKAGFTVQTATDRKAVQEALNQAQFDLVILGATLSRDDRHHLPYIAKKASKTTRVLVLHTDGSRHPYVDANIDTGEDLEHLLRKLDALQQPKAAAAAAGK